MYINPEKPEENRLRFLAALYEIASDRLIKDDSEGDVTLLSEYESVIGQRAGLTTQAPSLNEYVRLSTFCV